MLPVLLLLSRALGLYHKDEIRLGQKSLDEVPGLFQLATLFALGVWFMRHLLVGGETTGAHMTALLFGFLAIAFCMRLMARRVAQRLLAPERCLVIGDADAAGRLERALRLSTHGSLVVASIPCQSAAAELDLFTELSAPANLSEVVRSEQVDRLILAPRHHSTGHMLTLLNAAKAIGLRVTLVPFLGEVVGAAAEVESIGGVTVLGLPRFDLSRSARMIKRGLDSEDELIEVGVAIIGGGTAGLACANRLLQLLADDPETMERLGEVPSRSRSSSSAAWSTGPTPRRRTSGRATSRSGCSRSPPIRGSRGSGASCARPPSTSYRSCGTCWWET